MGKERKEKKMVPVRQEEEKEKIAQSGNRCSFQSSVVFVFVSLLLDKQGRPSQSVARQAALDGICSMTCDGTETPDAST